MYIPGAAEPGIGYDGWRITRHTKIAEALTNKLLKSQVGAAELDAFFKVAKGEAKPTMSKLEELLGRSSSIPFLPKGALTRLKSEARKARNLREKMREALTGKKLTLPKLRNLLKQHEKLAVYLPLVMEVDKEIQDAWQWDQAVRKSGIEQGTASLDHLRKLRDEGTKIRVALDLMPQLNEIVQPWCLCGNTTDGDMFGCEKCDNWFHPECVGVPMSIVNDDFKYYCPRCQIRMAVKETNLNVVASLSMYLNSEFKSNESLVDRGQHPVTGMGMIPHETACWLQTKLEELFPMAYKKLGTPANSAEEEKRRKVKDQFLKFATLARKELLNLIPPDTLRFDAEYYGDGAEDSKDVDCLKKITLNGKIGDGQMEDILEKHDLDFSMHLDMQSERLKDIIETCIDINRWASDTLVLMKPHSAIPLDYLAKCNRGYEYIIRKQGLRNQNVDNWNVFMKCNNEFKRIFQKAESYRRSIKSLNKRMNAWFRTWDLWHEDRGIDIHKEELREKQLIENPPFEVDDNDIPPGFSAKYSTVLKQLDKKKHSPVNFGTDFTNFERNAKKLESYLKLDDSYYKKKRKKQGSNAKYTDMNIARKFATGVIVENSPSSESASASNLKRKHETLSSGQYPDAKLKKFKENGPGIVHVDSKVANNHQV